MIGKTLGQYRILEQLGAGGMGVVYRARDERLERDVAVKVLPAGTLDDTARARFRQEALALAKLAHTNIAHIYDFNTEAGVDYLAMEHIPGITLSQKLDAGALPEKDVIALGAQIAAALEEAHEHGIVHRDLKPGNVMVTPKGQAKVLDFGLAKLLRQPGDADATRSLATAAVSGTLPYMAPEQLSGGAADPRTDIHALGCVLYEMMTGRRVFEEDSSPQLTDAILHRPPVSPRAINAKLSPQFESVILKCLEKDPEDRYQSVKELRVDLRHLSSSAAVSQPVAAPARPNWKRWGMYAAGAVVIVAALALGFDLGGVRTRWAGGASSQIRSLAVLPLENLSRDPEQDYFADGMTEALTANLTKIGALQVASRTSAMRYKGAKKLAPDIARELNVDALVEGSVQRVGDRVRITVELIRASSDRSIWADTYERDLRDVLALQSNVAASIASQIRVQLTPQEQARLSGPRSVNPQAYEDYLKGRFYWNKRTEASIQEGMKYFQQAIDEDPGFAPGYSGLADSVSAAAFYDFVAPKDVRVRGLAAANKAAELDANSAEAHASVAVTKMNFAWDLAGAEAEFRRAMELDPRYANAPHWYGDVLSAMGRQEEAIASSERALALDPVSLILNAWVGRRNYLARRYTVALPHLQKALDLDPNFTPALLHVGLVSVQLQKHDEAITAFQKAMRASDNSRLYVAGLAYAYAAAGKKSEARKVLDGLEKESKQRHVPPYMIALSYAALGEKEKAFGWLNRAFDESSVQLVWMRADPAADPLRADPRFDELARRIGLPH